MGHLLTSVYCQYISYPFGTNNAFLKISLRGRGNCNYVPLTCRTDSIYQNCNWLGTGMLSNSWQKNPNFYETDEYRLLMAVVAFNNFFLHRPFFDSTSLYLHDFYQPE